MTTPLDIKVIYGGSSRGRLRRGAMRKRWDRMVVLGVVGAAFAFAQYGATWWWADPELRVMFILNTEFGGVDTGAVVGQLIPRQSAMADGPPSGAAPRSKTLSAPPNVEGLTSRGALFVATIVGWMALSSLACVATALSAGSMLALSRNTRARRLTATLGVVSLGAAAWYGRGLWHRFGEFVPDFQRLAVGAVAVVAVLIGLLLARRAKRVALVAGVLTILAAGATVWGLAYGAQCSAVSQKYATPGVLALAFAVHSFWGWSLLFAGPRLRR